MKGRILAACIGLVIVAWVLTPFISWRWRQHDQTIAFRNVFRGEPAYNGKPLHEWAMDTQDEAITGEPSPLAIEAVKAVQTIGPAAIPWLIKWIKPPVTDSRMPGGAVYALKALGPEAKSAIPELAEILRKPPLTMDDQSSLTEAAEALSYLGTDAIPFMLAAATNLQGQHIQWELIQNFGNLGTNGVSAIPALIGWTQDKDSWVRLGAVNALGNIGMEPKIVIPVLRKALNDSDDLVRRDAASALGNFEKMAADALPDLIKALDDPDFQVQTGAIEGLGRLGEQPEIVLPLLAKKMRSDNWVVRRVAAYALGDLGGQQAFDILMRSTDDPKGFVREAVFQSLKKIDPKQLEKSGKKFYGTGQPRPNQP
jgi:HEAT repeat protein